MGRDPTRPLPAAVVDAVAQYGGALRAGRGVRGGDRGRSGMVGRARGHPGPPAVDGPTRPSRRHPRLRGRLRVALNRSRPQLARRRHPGHDARHLPTRVPAGHRRPPPDRPGHGGRRPQPRHRPPGHLRAGDPAPRPHGGDRRQRARRAHRHLRVRRLRDPALPDLHHRDLHRVPVRLTGGRRPLDPPRHAGPPGARHRRARPASDGLSHGTPSGVCGRAVALAIDRPPWPDWRQS